MGSVDRASIHSLDWNAALHRRSRSDRQSHMHERYRLLYLANTKGPFTHTMRVAAREIVTPRISMVAFTHTPRCALLCCARKKHKRQHMCERRMILR